MMCERPTLIVFVHKQTYLTSRYVVYAWLISLRLCSRFGSRQRVCVYGGMVRGRKEVVLHAGPREGRNGATALS